MKKILVGAGIACCLLATNANASQLRPYLGLGVGTSKVSLDNDLDYFAEESYLGLSVNAGLRVNPYFGVEAFYLISSEEDKSYDYWGDNNKSEVSMDAFGLDLIGYLPIAEGLSFLGTVGLGQYDIDVKLKGIDNNFSYSDSIDSLGYRFGAGMEYAFTDNIAARAIVRYVVFDDMSYEGVDVADDMTEFSFGVTYTF